MLTLRCAHTPLPPIAAELRGGGRQQQRASWRGGHTFRRAGEGDGGERAVAGHRAALPWPQVSVGFHTSVGIHTSVRLILVCVRDGREGYMEGTWGLGLQRGLPCHLPADPPQELNPLLLKCFRMQIKKSSCCDPFLPTPVLCSPRVIAGRRRGGWWWAMSRPTPCWRSSASSCSATPR